MEGKPWKTTKKPCFEPQEQAFGVHRELTVLETQGLGAEHRMRLVRIVSRFSGGQEAKRAAESWRGHRSPGFSLESGAPCPNIKVFSFPTASF